MVQYDQQTHSMVISELHRGALTSKSLGSPEHNSMSICTAETSLFRSKRVSDSLCSWRSLVTAIVREYSKLFPYAFKQISQLCFFGRSQTCSVIRIKISIVNEKLVQHIKNINPKCVFYTGWNSSTGDFSYFLPSFLLNSHTVTTGRLGKALILFSSELAHKKVTAA